MITRNAFIERYLAASGLSDLRTPLGFQHPSEPEVIAVRCACGESECQGWQMLMLASLPARLEAVQAALLQEILVQDQLITELDARLAACEAAEAEVVRLREEMSALYRAYVRLLEAGRDRIIDHGGTCDPVDRMEEGDPALIRARAVLGGAE